MMDVSTAQLREPPVAHRFYWPEVDGLRAIAVLSVVLFHLNRDLVPGGFVGVDVFFVISGFLITTILLDDLEERRLSLLRFYQRRIARIAPAAFLVLLTVLGAAALLYAPQDLASAGATAAAAALSVVNFKFATQSSYFHVSLDAQPLLHYWSLAVEEQFYVLFPATLFVAVRYVRRPGAVLAAGFAISLVACIWLTARQPVFAFYLLPTRAWELLGGALIALAHQRGWVAGKRLGIAMRWAGVALLALSFAALSEATAFPGAAALLPVLGTMLLLAAVGSAGGAVQHLLAHPIPVFIGKRSYSLYLWHWACFSMVDYALFLQPSGVRLALKIGISVVATLLTYRFVERPARQSLNQPRHRARAYAGMAVAVVALTLIGIKIREANYFDAKADTLAQGGRVIAPGHGASVALFGDSQAAMLGYTLAGMARERGITLHLMGVPGRNVLSGEPDTLWSPAQAYLQRARPDLLIVDEEWPDKSATDPKRLHAALEALRPLARQIVVLAPLPQPSQPSRGYMRTHGPAPVAEQNAAARVRAAAMLRQELPAGYGLIDAAPAVLTSDGRVRIVTPAGVPTFQDEAHISTTGAEIYRAAFAKLLGALPPQQR